MQLSPYIAARLADAVYGILDTENVAIAAADYLRAGTGRRKNAPVTPDIGDDFDLSGSAIQGKSGASVLLKKTGFGIVVKGKGSYAGDIAVVCRGTAARQDWLSNINIATDYSVSGLAVHAGFNRVYMSMAQEVNNCLRNVNPTNIHLVGHSLGGAVANIFAANFAAQSRGNVLLYTFGAPRPATQAFADYLTSQISFDGIRRVYALADVVPMLPLWPFVHSSQAQGDLRIPQGGQGLSLAAHSMTNNYLPAVTGRTWQDMRAASIEAPDLKSIDYWLDQASGSTALPFSGVTLWSLGKALQMILALARGVVGLALTGAATAIDRIALLLSRAAAVSKVIGGYLVKLMAGVFRFLGRVYKTTQELTTAFLSYVLNLLFTTIANIGRNASV